MKSNFKKFSILVVLCLVLCAVFAGCTSPDYEGMYDDESKIASSSSHTTIASVENNSNGKYTFTCSSLSGVMVAINSFKVDESTSADLSFEVTDGKAKVVLVKDKTVYTVAEGSHDGILDLKNIPEGKYKLKIVGVKAEINLTLKY